MSTQPLNDVTVSCSAIRAKDDPNYARAMYWPFGELLWMIYCSARQNEIDWPPTTRLQWLNLDNIREAMVDTFKLLTPAQQAPMLAEFKAFLSNDKNPAIDWREMAEYKEPTTIYPGRKIMESIARNEAGE